MDPFSLPLPPTATATATATAPSTAAGHEQHDPPPAISKAGDHDDLLAPFAHPDFDPVAYAANVFNNNSQNQNTDTEDRLAFAAHDLSRQIDALVATNHATLAATVNHFDQQSRHVSSLLQPRLDSLASLTIQWRSSIALPAHALKSSLALARSSRDVHALALLLSHLTNLAAQSLPELPTHIADPECVSDDSIPLLAATLSDLAASLSLVDLSGMDLVDNVLAPHIAGCRAALLARCNAMVHPKDHARTQLALQGLATLGVLTEWHALRRAKVIGKLDNAIKDWVDTVCNAENQNQNQKTRGNKPQANVLGGAFLAQFESKVVDFLVAEAQFLHVLLTTHPIADATAWSDFWSAVASALDRHLASAPSAQASPSITLAYPTICASLGALTSRTPATIPLDLPQASLAPLQAHYLARVQSLVQSSLTTLFRTSTSLASSSSSLPPVPPCDAIHTLIQSWTLHLPNAPHIVAAGIDQLASSLLSLCSESILLVELFHDHTSPTPAQAQVAHVARALLCVHAATMQLDNDTLCAASERVLSDAAQLVDILLQAVIASIHAAMLDPAASSTNTATWTSTLDGKLAIARALLGLVTPSSSSTSTPAIIHDFVAHARLVLVGTLLQHVPVAIALVTPAANVQDHSGRLRLVDALAATENALARVLEAEAANVDVHAIATFRHFQALRMSVLLDVTDLTGEGERAAGWARAASASPVVVGTWRVMMGGAQAAEVARWMRVNKATASKRDVGQWVLAWVERWDAAVADGDKRQVWSEWTLVMDRVLGQGGWVRLVGEFGQTVNADDDVQVKVEDE